MKAAVKVLRREARMHRNNATQLELYGGEGGLRDDETAAQSAARLRSLAAELEQAADKLAQEGGR